MGQMLIYRIMTDNESGSHYSKDNGLVNQAAREGDYGHDLPISITTQSLRL